MAEPETTLADVLADGGDATRFSTPEISQYLAHITSLGLPDVVHEPTALASEASQLTNSLTSLCYAEYPTFLSLHRTSAVLSSTLSSFSASLSALAAALPTLDAQARQFSVETHAIQDVRTKARRVLSQHDALVDVLDVPALIDACVRNAHYQEAMDLSAHAERLASALPDVAIVQDVAAEAEHAMRLMRAQLLALLREAAKLPALFKAVSFLRKMGAFSEPELALVFLVSRLSHLENALDSIGQERSDYARYVRRYVDVWREGVSDVVTQYTTIFLERAASSELAVELRYLLSTLTHHALDALLSVLRAHLSGITDATSLAALLTQLTHCAAALARVGLDFRSLLPPLFEHAVQQRFEQAVTAATSAFLSTLSDSQKYHRQPSTVLCTPESVASPPKDVTFPSALHAPPTVLASYPPLALYTNALLAALNSLRLLAPTALFRALLAELDTTLARSATAFLSYAQNAVESTSTTRTQVYGEDEDPPDQERIVRSAGKVFTRLLVPYARRALGEGVYGIVNPKSLAESKELREALSQWDTWLDPPDSAHDGAT